MCNRLLKRGADSPHRIYVTSPGRGPGLVLVDVFQIFPGDVWGGDCCSIVEFDNESAFAFDAFDDAFASFENARDHSFAFSFEEAGVVHREVDYRFVVVWGHDEEGLHDAVRNGLGLAFFSVSVDEELVVQFELEPVDGRICALNEVERPYVAYSDIADTFILQ